MIRMATIDDIDSLVKLRIKLLNLMLCKENEEILASIKAILDS